MAFKLVAFAAFVTVASAGVLPEAYSSPIGYAAPALAKVAYSEAPAVSYSSLSAPVQAYAAAPAYASAPAYAKIAAPVSYASPAVSYAAPALSYAAPALKVAAPVSYAAPVAYAAPVTKTIIAEPEAPAHYDFGYSVNDPHTGDSKSQQESRRGDVVQGSYSLIDADGTKRTVEYAADDHNGFNAVVHKEPAQVAVKAIAKVAAPVAYASPVSYAAPVAKIAAPISYAAPAYAQPLSYAAPVAKIAAPISYAAPAYAQPISYAAPVAKYAAPVQYAAPLGHGGYYH